MIFLQCFLGCLFAFIAILVVVLTIVLPSVVRQFKAIPQAAEAFKRGASIVDSPSTVTFELEAARNAWEQANQLWADAASCALDTLHMTEEYADAEARERVRIFLINHMAISGYHYTYDGIAGMKPSRDPSPRQDATS